MKKIKLMPNIILMMLCMMISVSASAQCHLSKEGRKFIQRVEKCSLKRYWDNGAWSIGYGHRMTGKMTQYKNVIMVEKPTVTKYTELDKMDTLCAEHEVNVLGVVCC